MNDLNSLPLTPEMEFRQIGLATIKARIEQSKRYISEAQAQIIQANRVIEIQSYEVARLELILKAIEGN